LEKYADGNYERAIEEHDSPIRKGRMHETRKEIERIWELRDYPNALRWQSLREKYADWDYARVKEEIGKFTEISEHWSFTGEEGKRYGELFSYMGAFRREYLLERYADWDIARAEKELDRLGNVRRERPLTNKEFFERLDILHYIGISPPSGFRRAISTTP